MKVFKHILTILLTTTMAVALAQQPFTAGNLVVYRVGDGTTSLSASIAKVFLDEYTQSGVLVQSVPMPTTGQRITMSGSFNLGGMLTLSADGKYLVVPGFDLDPGAATGASLPRSIGLVDCNGDVRSVTTITNNPNSVAIISAGSDNGTNLWFTGTDGLEYTKAGVNSSTKIVDFAGSPFSYGLSLADGQLYLGQYAGGSNYIGKVGSGMPVTTGQIFGALPGFPDDRIPYQFAFADLDLTIPGADVLYFASQGSAAGGISKYSFVNGVWVSNGVVGTTTERYTGLTVRVTGNSAAIFATRRGSNSSSVRGGQLVSLIDNSGYNGALSATPTVLASVATANTMAFRGVALVPQPVPFTPGNLAVYRVGDGASVLDGKTAKVYIDEYTTAGSLVQSILMPSTGKKLTNFGTDQYGFLTLSADGKYLLVPGYNLDLGATAQADQAIAVIDPKASVTVDVIANPALDLMRSVASDNGNNLWFANGTAGVNFTTHGSTTVATVGSLSSSNAVLIVNGQLYASSNGNTTGIVTIGQGLPSAPGQTVTAFPGIPLRTRAQQFALVDMEPSVPGVDVLYLASLNPLSPGGIQKYSLVGGTWVFNGQVGATGDRYAGLTIKQSANSNTIYATRKGNNSLSVAGGELVSLSDNGGYNATLTGTPTVIASVAAADTKAFRGLARVPLNCPSVSNLRTAGVASSQAIITWPPVATGSGNYEYAFNTTGLPPSSGTVTSSTSAQLTGLSNATTYYAFVRTVCNANNTSEWNTISFITGCKPPSAPAVSVNIAANGLATVKWNAVFGATSYEYLVSTSATPPSLGSPITDTSITVSNLNAVTSYYVHVRSNCGAGVFSAWTTKAFTTGCFLPVTNAKILKNGAGVSWNKITNAVKYEYALTATPAHPLSGTFTIDSFYLSGKLSDGSSSYFQVRSICSNGSVSEWSTTGLNIPGINVYPNPVKDILTIQLNGQVNASSEIAIADAMGRLVTRIKLSGSTTPVNTRSWAAGVYLLRYDDGQNKYSVRIVKQ